MRRLCLGLLLWWCCLAAVSGFAAAGERFALIVGTSDYRHVPRLANPVTDASDIADTLGRLGFRVQRGVNLNLAQFKALVADFSQAAAGADAVVFYYAGHGFQLNGRIYLIPVDATLASQARISDETLRLNDIIAGLGRHSGQTVILLDTSLDNPLPLSERGGGAQQGLVPVDMEQETFVAFATQPGNVASDGSDRHSPFTQALLTHLPRPRLSLAEMMADVRKDVVADTGGRQVPWDQSSLHEQFYFSRIPSTKLIAPLLPRDEPKLEPLAPSEEPPAPPALPTEP